MTSPIPPPNSDHGVPMHRLVSPAARLFAATVIMITGAGLSAVFWKMPGNGELHALYNEEVMDKVLAAVPLPSETIATISQDEMQQMNLPMPDFAPAMEDGAVKYAQVYPMPESLAMLNAEQDRVDSYIKEDEPPIPAIPLKPMRQMLEEKPISLEPVSKVFQTKPARENVIDRNDVFLTRFYFAENNKAVFDGKSEPDQPVDPFSQIASSEVASSLPTLLPLKTLPLDNLSPLLPLQENELQTLSVLIPQ